MGGLDARVRELREAVAKLAANVVWRSGVPVAVKAARWTTADEIEEVEEPTVEVVEEKGGAGETDPDGRAVGDRGRWRCWRG